MPGKISACVTCFNEEDKIRRCLKSLTWCDEIVVVDSFSKDKTPDICREYTDRVYQHEWLGYIGQKNLIRKMASHNWVLFLDADEEVPPELRKEIQNELSLVGPYVGYQFPRMVYYLGKWIRHGEWYPDTKLRLFQRDKGRSGGREPHDHVIVDGPIKTLKNPIFHYTYDDIFDHMAQMNRFSSITARAKFEEGIRARLSDLIFRPPHRFMKSFVFRNGWLDGRRGFIIAVISALGVALKYAKLWELELEDHRQVEGSNQFPSES